MYAWGGMNSHPQKDTCPGPNPSTWVRELIQKRGLCCCDSVKDLGRHHSGLGSALNLINSIFGFRSHEFSDLDNDHDQVLVRKSRRKTDSQNRGSSVPAKVAAEPGATPLDPKECQDLPVMTRTWKGQDSLPP